MINKHLLTFFFLFCVNFILYSQCNVNAGGNATICGTTYTLGGNAGGNPVGSPTWSLVSKPVGATDPVISDVNSYTPLVSGLDFPGNYVFEVSQPCNPSGVATSQITITAPGDASTFTAGPDITTVSAITGEVILNGNVPDGYSAQWSAYNIYRWERSSIKTNQNSQFGSPTSATTTFSLINKANHDIDPAYVVTLRIISDINPNCWYEDTAIVRFIPNPQITPNLSTSRCISSNGRHIISLGTPHFSHGYTNAPGSSGNFGTDISLNVVSQPLGGNITYDYIYDSNINISGVNTIGTYKFTLTVSNTNGTYTTPEITYLYNGTHPSPVNFLVSTRPEQMMIYQSGNSGGEVHCDLVGQSTPITFYYTIHPDDNVSEIITNAYQSGIYPSGGAVSIINGGAGTATRNATLTPPPGGWSIGTYKLTISRSNGTCSATQAYYIHISDGSRGNVLVPNTTVCYPGSGTVSATIPLPEIYKGVVNSSYFQDFDGRYRITLVSKPTGAADPVFEPFNQTLFTNASTTISNLNMSGEYEFKIEADTYTPSVGAFLEKEYACSGSSLESTFSVFVSNQVNANAGSDQNLSGGETLLLNGNNPGDASSGVWTLETKPTGAAEPVIIDPELYNTTVTGITLPGVYTFKWTIFTGDCISSDETNVNYLGSGYSPGGVSSGLTYWYRADVDAENSGDETHVTKWTDVWAGTTVSQMGDNVLPMFKEGDSKYFNFNPGIHFTNRDQSLGNNLVQTLTNLEYDIFTFTKEGVASGGGNPRIFSIGMDNITTGITNWDAFGLWPTNNLERRVYGGGTSFPSFLPYFSTNVPSIMYFKNTDTSTRKGLNGSEMGSSRSYSAQGYQFGGHIFGNTVFSSNGSDNRGFIGNIGETIVYGSGTLSKEERRRVDSYLAIKYGITLDQVETDNYLDASAMIVWDGVYNTIYNNNIFGVAREDIGMFEQRVSTSVNDGSILTIATIDDFEKSNLDVARFGFINDNTYFLLGDNEISSKETEGLEIGGEQYKIIQRKWLSQRQDLSGNLYFQVDLSNYGIDFSLINDVKMIIADDESFTINVRLIDGVNELGKWVHMYNFDSSAIKQYVTYGVKAEQCLPEFVWSSPVNASGTTAIGAINGIDYTYSSDNTVYTSPSIFNSYNVFPLSEEPGDIFSFPRTNHRVIRNIAATNNTLTFDTPITDPVLVFSSLGNSSVAPVPIIFDQPMELLWSDSYGANGFVTWDSSTQITGREGYAIVRIPGTHTSISFEYTAAENYANFMFGIAIENDCDDICYKPGLITGGPILDTKVGITSLSRAGVDDADNWPMVRKGGWIVLESREKGFVPNRVAFSTENPDGIPVGDFVEGMMVYDTTNKCMKVYTTKEGEAEAGWHCMSTQACPD